VARRVRGSPWRKPLSWLVLVLLAAAGATAAYGVSSGSAATPLLDIEIAIDTTSSMGASIRQAQDDSKKLVNDVRARYPGALFAVVQFKDSGDTPEYQLLQPMTGDAVKVDGAIDTLTPQGGGDFPEAYNLVFQNSTDAATGWRASSRKLVVVIGDAEPHGAGTAGFKGCSDTSTDPHGLNTASVLAAMKSAQRTLIMVRQAATASTTLECYQSLAAAAYVGGAARNGGENIVAVIEALIGAAATTPTKTTGTSTRPSTTGTTANPATPPPAGKENVVATGTVLIKVRGKFVPLTGFKVVPYGTELDTTKGRVKLTSHDGSVGTFYEGRFKLLPELDTPVPGKPSRRVTALALTGGDFKVCTVKRAVSGLATPKPKPVRHAWGNAKGGFRTKGRFASATVRGTLWRTDDRCDGTLITVKRGKVDVFDRVKRKHILVPAGKSYLAPAPVRR
jgi:hypothetical protein